MADKQSGQGFGVTGNLVASVLVSGGASIGVKYGAPYLAHFGLTDLSDNAWNAIAAAIFIGGVALGLGLKRIAGWVRHAVRSWAARARSSGNKLTIVVERLESDDGTQTHHIVQSLQEQLGKTVEVLPDSTGIVVTTASAEDQKKKAAALLKASKSDVVIWGIRFAENNIVELHFLGKDQPDEGGNRYSLNDKLLLPENFGTDLGAQIAVQAALMAAPAHDDGHYVAGLLRPAVRRLKHLVQNLPATLSSDAKGRIILAYALACQTIGEQAGENDSLLGAIAAYREALKEYKRERSPLDWAMTQINLGNSLAILGQREAGTARLEEGVVAFREALKEYTRERVPLDWAGTQNNLGNALAVLGAREASTARLDESVTAYREALKEYTRERVPLQWATTQNNLGNALQTLGECEAGTERLDEAVCAYCEALKEYTRERVPLNWAATQNNLGNALRTLGERENSTARLNEAVTAFREALKERTRERVPLDWAAAQNNLGNALRTLGKREAGTAHLEEAVTAYRAAMGVFQEAGTSYYIELATQNLAEAEKLLAERRKLGGN